MPRPRRLPQHPGEILFDWIVENGHTQSWLAEQTGTSLKHINHIVRGKSLYGEELAVKFGWVTDRDAYYWASLRMHYRIAELEQNLAAQRRRRRK